MRSIFAAILILATSCAGVVAPGDSGQVQFDLTWHQTRDQLDSVRCHYLKTPNSQDVEIERIAVDFPEGSHHVHIYRSDTAEADGVEDCTAGIDWNRWSLLVGVQTKPLDWGLPDGVTIPLKAHQQLLIQVHWLNLTGQDIDRTISVRMQKTEQSAAHLGVAFGISKDVHMQPSQSKSIGGWLPVPRDAKLVAIMGHFHGRGVGYRVDLRRRGEAAGTVVYQAQDEQTFEFKNYANAGMLPQVGDGQGLAYECDFINHSGFAITWGPNTANQEHCNLAAYYYPAGNPPSTIGLSGDLDRVAALPSSLLAGQAISSTVWLKQPAGPLPVEVAIEPSDTNMVAPFSVRVPAWTQSTPFTVAAKRPGELALHMTTGSTVLDQPLQIEGLALSEISYQPGRQWVELANIGDVPIDLSRFSLGAGGSNYAVTRVGLGKRMLPPAACLLIGDPAQLPPEDPTSLVFVSAATFSPALSLGDIAAGGVALFDAPAAADALPFDAVAYGARNVNQLPAAGGGVAVPVPAAPAGGSLERTAAGWNPLSTPTPGICRVPHAP